jgi:hypothetical protein
MGSLGQSFGLTNYLKPHVTTTVVRVFFLPDISINPSNRKLSLSPRNTFHLIQYKHYRLFSIGY